MKTFFKKLLVLFTIIVTTSAIVNISFPTPTHAADFGCRYFLGLTSWDCGLAEFDNEDHLKSNIIIIASNVFVDITVIAAYLVLGYVIYGGYLYIFSAGDPNKVTTGKKTLIHAFTGLAIILLSNIILNAIRYALIANHKFSDQGCLVTDPSCSAVEPEQIITNLINWIIGISGITAAVFAVMGGIGYVTSSGDPQKLKKAKDTIIYALIGLAIVGLAQIITAFISNMIKDAKTASYPNETLIAKEYHEKQTY